MSEVILLDVGHGNCSIVRSGEQAAVVDAGHGATLWETLNQEGIKTVHAVIISHADRDHIAGVANLLTSKEISIETIYLNPDATKNMCGASWWNMLRSAVADARKHKGTKSKIGVTTDDPGIIDIGDIQLEVMFPTPELVMGGPGAKTPDGKHDLTSNTVSIVLRATYKGVPLVLLTGDIDGTGLEQMRGEKEDISAKVLVFPHHGGLPGREQPEAFTQRLLDGTNAEMVFFSNGRSHHSNPRPEIIEAISSRANVKVICSQLSKSCSEECANSSAHINELPAKGKHAGDSCGGSIRLKFDDLISSDYASLKGHEVFVASIQSALCRRSQN